MNTSTSGFKAINKHSLLACQSAVRGELDVHEDYYAGFAQGAYYGFLS